MTVRILGPGDEAALDSFLKAYADSSMFLRSALHNEGIVSRGQPLQATFAAAEEGGRIIAVAGHFGNGNLHFQAPVHALDVAHAALEATGRGVRGLLGPWEQLESIEDALAPGTPDSRSREFLFAIDLDDLRVPTALNVGGPRCRRAAAADLELLTEWRQCYRVAVGVNEPDLARHAREDMHRMVGRGEVFLLEAEGRPVACCTFNARIPDTVQIGGVWTPPDLRARGYARAVVAGALLYAAREGVTRSILFTDEHNRAAQTAYRALGYRQVGLYGAILYWA